MSEEKREEQRNVELLRSAYEGYSRKDPSTFLSLVSDDVRFGLAAPVEFYRFAGVRQGKKWMERVIREIAEDYDWLSYQAREFIAERDRVVVLAGGKIRHRSSGKLLNADLVDTIRMKDGRIVEFVEYFDTGSLYLKQQKKKPRTASGKGKKPSKQRASGAKIR